MIQAVILCVCAGLQGPAPSPPVEIMGQGLMSRGNLAAFFMENNPAADLDEVTLLASLYLEECTAEGVNSDLAFAQMCLETGFLRFLGLVEPWMNNFCGLGAVSASQRGVSFQDVRTGVRAHVQHLKAYGSTEPLNLEQVDPRFHYVNPRGKAPDLWSLAGTWAADPEYGAKLYALLERLYQSAVAQEQL